VLGRPAYISTGSAAQLPADRSVEAFRDNTFRMLDAAVRSRIDWIDTARSYGRAEEFVGQWWRARAAQDVDWPEKAPTVSSKWGYRYVGAWDPRADVHEVKEHSLAIFTTLFVISGQPNWLGFVAPILILVTAGFRLRRARPRDNAR